MAAPRRFELAGPRIGPAHRDCVAQGRRGGPRRQGRGPAARETCQNDRKDGQSRYVTRTTPGAQNRSPKVSGKYAALVVQPFAQEPVDEAAGSVVADGVMVLPHT